MDDAARNKLARDHHARGMALVAAGRLGEAAEAFREAVGLHPAYATAWCNLGLVLEDLGRGAEAVDALKRAKAHAVEADVAFIDYHLAALGSGPSPAACPADYLVRLFDGYAPRFDDHLVNRLGYRGPWLLRDAVMPLLAGGTAGDVIDLGCGTGLCGMPFRPVARSLVGVDLSPRMLERAASRGVYDQLIRSDVTAALFQRPAAVDLVLAADVFIYVGDLAPVFQAAAVALRPGGLLAFTLEVTEAADFKLEPSRRYAHWIDYVRRVAVAAGLTERSASAAFLRAGETAPVRGAVVVLSKPAL